MVRDFRSETSGAPAEVRHALERVAVYYGLDQGHARLHVEFADGHCVSPLRLERFRVAPRELPLAILPDRESAEQARAALELVAKHFNDAPGALGWTGTLTVEFEAGQVRWLDFTALTVLRLPLEMGSQ